MRVIETKLISLASERTLAEALDSFTSFNLQFSRLQILA